MVGIYRIRNTYNNKCYYGSSKDITFRWKTHISKLGRGTHENILLQRAWDKYGDNSFKFEVVEECDKLELLVKEQTYLDLLPDYNIGKSASGGDNISNHPNRETIIENIKAGLLIRLSAMTIDEKRKLFGKMKDDNNNWKGGKTFCKCGNRIDSITVECSACRDRTGTKNPFYGKKHSEEVKQKISKSRKGTYHGSQNAPIIVDSVEYRSAGEASKLLNIPMTTIRWRVKSSNSKFNNYQYT